MGQYGAPVHGLLNRRPDRARAREGGGGGCVACDVPGVCGGVTCGVKWGGRRCGCRPDTRAPPPPLHSLARKRTRSHVRAHRHTQRAYAQAELARPHAPLAQDTRPHAHAHDARARTHTHTRPMDRDALRAGSRTPADRGASGRGGDGHSLANTLIVSVSFHGPPRRRWAPQTLGAHRLGAADADA